MRYVGTANTSSPLSVDKPSAAADAHPQSKSGSAEPSTPSKNVGPSHLGLVEAWAGLIEPPKPSHALSGGSGSWRAEAARHGMGAPPPSTSVPFGPHSFRIEQPEHPKTASFLAELGQLGISKEIVSIVASDLRPSDNEAALMTAVRARFTPAEGEQIGKALEVARRAHAGQTQKRKSEKDGLDHIPYFNHCLQVARMTLDLGGDAEMVQASLLHDVVEDTPVTMAELQKSFTDRVLEMVGDVTRGNDESRADYLDRVTKLGPASSSLKALDRLHNLVRSFSTRDPEYLSRYLEETKRIYRPKMQSADLSPLRPLFEKLISEMDALKKKLDQRA
ncbi:MAG: HD domain-containing protein [Myxococcota bacterium]